MHALAAQRLAELGLQNVVDAVDDEIHHLYRGVDNAEALGHFRESVAEKLVVQFHHDFLFAFGIGDAFGAQLHTGIELFQCVGFFVQPVFLQHIQHALYGQRHGVVLGKTVAFEQRIKHGFGDQVLGQHFNDFAVADAVVQVVTQFMGKAVEGLLFFAVGRVFQNGGDAVDMGAGNLGNVIGPVFPVAAVAAFLHHLGIQGAFDFAYFKLQSEVVFLGVFFYRLANAETALAGVAFFLGDRPVLFVLDFVSDGDHFHFGFVIARQFQLVDHGVEAVIVRAQGLQHLPHHAVGLVVIQRFMRLDARRNHHRQDHITALLARRVAHHAPHRLHHIHL